MTLMPPCLALPRLEYVHPVTPNMTLGPASGEEGEFVALPLSIQPVEEVVDLVMVQTVLPSATTRNLVSPYNPTFLKNGRPELHFSSCNLESPINSLYLNIFG